MAPTRVRILLTTGHNDEYVPVPSAEGLVVQNQPVRSLNSFGCEKTLPLPAWKRSPDD